MAIDTAAKRRAAGHVARMWGGAGVTPTTGGNASWRRWVGRVYNNTPTPAGTYSYTATGGITFGGAAVVELHNVTRVYVASGGIVFSGAASYTNSMLLLSLSSTVHGRLPCGRLGALRQSR